MYFNSSDLRIPLEPNAIVQIESGKRYIIDRYIASGGFCLMYLAHEEGSERYVALKELYPRRAENVLVHRVENGSILFWNPYSAENELNDPALVQEFSRYFQREVQLTRKAGAVYTPDGRVGQQNNFDFLRIEGPMTDTRGNQYLAVDTFQGESLRDFIERGFVRNSEGKVLSNQNLADILQILAETAVRLSALHDQAQMLHLDLSPDNIYLAYTGKNRRHPFIIDYGSAYDLEDPGELVDHRFTWNPHSAPEVLAQTEAADTTGFYSVDESTDTYSLVSVLFYAATGQIFTPEMRIIHQEWKDRIAKAYSSGIASEPDSDSFAAELIRFLEKGLSSAQPRRFRTATALHQGLLSLAESYRRYGNLLAQIPGDELMSYLVLDKHPLYRYMSEDGDVHVLCLGSGVFTRRMILSMISCGQIIGSHLHIHIVSGEEYNQFADALLKEAPSLRAFSNLGTAPVRTYVTFHYVQVGDVLEETTCRQVIRTHSNARYLLISLGKNRLNADAARLYAREAAAAEWNSRTIINYYSAEDAAGQQAFLPCDAKLPAWLEVDAFADDLSSYTAVQHDLGIRTIRLAHMYNKLKNPRISLIETEKAIAQNAYEQKSSCAAALHLKYKLAGLGIDPEAEKEAVISGYLSALRGRQYGSLLENEHNRWLMNLVSEGYRAPSAEELRRYGFEMTGDVFNGTWKHIGMKLHPCLVPCDDGGIRLSASDWDHYDTAEKIAEAPFDDLDRVSLQLHMLAGQKSALRKDTVSWQIRNINARLNAVIQERSCLNASGLEQLRRLEQKLKHVEQMICDAVQILRYSGDHGALKELQEDFDELGINISGEITQLRNTLAVFREYAAETDYKKADAAIIDNLLWLMYADSDITLVKICGSTIVSNISSPLTLAPKNLVYYGTEYRDEWASFLRAQGFCGEIIFRQGQDTTAQSAARGLQRVIFGQKGRVVIDVTGAEEALIAAAKTICDQNSGLALICVDRNGKIENLSRFPDAEIYSSSGKLSAEDIFRLYGAAADAP